MCISLQEFVVVLRPRSKNKRAKFSDVSELEIKIDLSILKTELGCEERVLRECKRQEVLGYADLMEPIVEQLVFYRALNAQRGAPQESCMAWRLPGCAPRGQNPPPILLA